MSAKARLLLKSKLNNMTNIYEVPADKLNKKLAEELSKIKEFEMPEWSYFIKTSPSKARPPFDEQWWYVRAASILRQIYRKGVVGVNRLKTRYGGRKTRGSKPEKFVKASGKIIRTILQQAERAGFLKKSERKKKGRELTKQGLEFINKAAGEVKEI